MSRRLQGGDEDNDDDGDEDSNKYYDVSGGEQM